MKVYVVTECRINQMKALSPNVVVFKQEDYAIACNTFENIVRNRVVPFVQTHLVNDEVFEMSPKDWTDIVWRNVTVEMCDCLSYKMLYVVTSELAEATVIFEEKEI